MNTGTGMAPANFMLDAERREKLRSVSAATRISMSELVRLSVDHLMNEIGDYENPDANALLRLMKTYEQRAASSYRPLR